MAQRADDVVVVPNQVVDIRRTFPPESWGVTVNHDAIAPLARSLAAQPFVAPGEGMHTMPHHATPSQWCDFIGMSVSVLACLWAPDGHEQWTVQHNGETLTDAPAFFHAFARTMPLARDRDGYDLSYFVNWTVEDAYALFAGDGVFQLIPQRCEQLRATAKAMIERFDGSFLTLVRACEYDAERVVRTLVEHVPGYDDVAPSALGWLPFEKLPRLATAMMAVHCDRPLRGLNGFPVYPDYMLPKVFRHWGIFDYDAALAATIDERRLVPADSEWEHALRWATVATADALRAALAEIGCVVTGPELDFNLWHAGVLGPDALLMGEHHRTLTMRY